MKTSLKEREYKREWRKRNREKENLYQQRYRLKNPEKIKGYLRKYREKHPERVKEFMKQDYLKHMEKRKKQVSEYQKKNRKKITAYKTEYRRQRRLKIINAYGGKCACCGESNQEFLAIDHVNGDGKKDRAKYKNHQLHSIIIKLNYPPKYRILCHNCNMSLGFYGYCPHKEHKHGLQNS